MNEQNVENRRGKLEGLSEEMRSNIIELAVNCRLVDIVLQLKQEGIETSAASLSRFIRRQREGLALQEGRDMKEAVNALAEQGRGGHLREGTMEAVRQRLYERALCSQDPKEARELHAALVKEEARVKELELEARRVAVAEQQVKLQQLRIEVTLRERQDVSKVKVTAADSVVDVPAADGWKKLEEEKRALLLVMAEVNDILNLGGDPCEKILQARDRLGDGIRLLGCGTV